MKTIALITCNILFAMTSIAQVKKIDTVINKVFPNLSAETLSKKTVEISKKGKGKKRSNFQKMSRENQRSS